MKRPCRLRMSLLLSCVSLISRPLIIRGILGDGSPIQNGQVVTHTFAKSETPTTFEVTCNGEVPQGCSATSQTQAFAVSEQTCPVITDIASEIVSETATTVEYQFTAVMAQENERALSYNWDFGDGSSAGEGQVVNHVYAKSDIVQVVEVTVNGEVPQECEATSQTMPLEIGGATCIEIVEVIGTPLGEDAISIEYEFTLVLSPEDDQGTLFTWDMGDGSPPKTGRTVRHLYDKKETEQQYNVSVLGDGNSDCPPTSGVLVLVVPEISCGVIAQIDKEIVRENAVEVEYKFTAVVAQPDELPTSFTWDFGDGSQGGTGQVVNHIYARQETGQEYDVVVAGEVPQECAATSATTKVDVSEQACPVIARIAMEVVRQNAIEIEYKFTAEMVEPEELALSYEWDFGDGSDPGSGQIVNHVYTRTDADQEFDVVVNGEVPEQCAPTSSTTKVDVSEKTCPVIASIDKEEVRQNAVEIEYKFTAVMAEPDELALSYEWDFGDDTPNGIGQIVNHVYSRQETDQDYDVVVTGEVPEGCDATSAMLQLPVTERTCPVIQSIDVQPVRQNAIEVEYAFTATLAEPDEPALSYEWDFGDGSPPGVGEMVNHTYAREEEDKVYNVAVIGEVPAECDAASSSITVGVPEKACPVIESIEKEVVRQDAVEIEYKFTALLAESDELASSYSWDFGDGSPAGAGQVVSHIYTRQEGDQEYDVTVTGVVPPECGSSTTATTMAEVLEKMCPVIASIEKVVVRQDAVEIEYTFTAVLAESDEVPASFTWDFGDGSPAGSGQMVNHAYTRQETDKEYDVVVTGDVPDVCDPTSATTKADVLEKMCAVIASIEKEVVRQNAIEIEYKFTALMAEPDELATAYSWDFGDGSSSGSGQIVNHTYTRQETNQEYDVVVTGDVPDVCDATSATTKAEVGEKACAVITSIEKEVVREDAVEIEYKFTAVMAEPDELATAYSWDFGDGSSSGSGEIVNHTYTRQETDQEYDVVVTGDVPAECDVTSATTKAPVTERTCAVIASIEKEIVREDAVEIEYKFTALMAEPDELATAYSWDFGDGSPAGSGQVVNHTYTRQETDLEYDVVVTGEVPDVCDPTTATTKAPVTENTCPVIDRIERQVVEETDIVITYEFTAVLKETDEAPAKYTWTFGDNADDDGAEGEVVRHTYVKNESAQEYEVKVVGEVPTECVAAEATTNAPVSVITCPTIQIQVSAPVAEGEEVEYAFTVAVSGEMPDRIEWDFGDQTPPIPEGALTESHTYPILPGMTKSIPCVRERMGRRVALLRKRLKSMFLVFAQYWRTF